MSKVYDEAPLPWTHSISWDKCTVTSSQQLVGTVLHHDGWRHQWGLPWASSTVVCLTLSSCGHASLTALCAKRLTCLPHLFLHLLLHFPGRYSTLVRATISLKHKLQSKMQVCAFLSSLPSSCPTSPFLSIFFLILSCVLHCAQPSTLNSSNVLWFWYPSY